ncbi:MAG: nucleotidyltransferase family protein [Eubacteriales bacterium]
MERLGYVMTQLLRWELTGTFVGGFDPSEISPEDWMQLYPLALKHDVAHLVGEAAEKLGVLPECNLSDQYAFQVLQAHYRQERYQFALEALCGCLEDAQICYIPLKGCVLKSRYPEPWMRTSCDIDILLHSEDIPRAADLLTRQLHYQLNYSASHDMDFRSDDGVRVELHFDLVEDGRVNESYEVLSKIWEHARPRSVGSYLYVMDDAMFSFYHIAHMAKHVLTGGCGIRPFLDLWLMDRNGPIWTEELTLLLRQGKLDSFAHAVQGLIEVCFQDAKPDETLQQFQQFILDGGVHGSKKNASAVAQLRSGGKRNYMISRVFLPYEDLKYQYPVLQKHRWLLPACEIRRWYSLFIGKKSEYGRSALRTVRNVSEKEIRNASWLLEQLGL